MPSVPIEIVELPYAYGKPNLKGVLKQSPDCFVVEEQLGFEPSGEGEHVFLWVEKQGLNTQQVADALASLAKIPVRQVSYAGMKDRHALTRQWFSVHLPGNHSVDWAVLNSDKMEILSAARHLRKLKRGAHKGNRFKITLTNLEGDLDAIKERIDRCVLSGVPNYFGEQRFGHGGSNIRKAEQWFAGEFKPKKHQRGIYLSAARSFLFNQVLSRRVQENTWGQLLAGELLMLNGSNSVFAQQAEENLNERLLEGDIHLTGPLFGLAGKLCSSLHVNALETEVLSHYPTLLAGLERAKLKSERRSLRLIPQDMTWSLNDKQIQLNFSLPSGCFATAVVRELVLYQTA